MKIVHLVPSMESGGVEQVVMELGSGLSSRGVENIVVSGGGRLVPRLEKEGSRHILMPIGKKSISTLFRIGALRALLQAVRPDILHLHSRVPAWAGYLAWKKLPPEDRPGLVTSVHGFYSVNRYSAIMSRGERVIAVSNCIRDYILDHYPSTPPDHIKIIPNAISPDQYHPAYSPSREWLTGWFMSYPELKGKFTLCLPGRITRLKGHLDLIPVVRQLLEQGIPAHAVIVGEAKKGKEEYKNEVLRAIERSDVSQSFTWTGHRQDLREILSTCSVTLSLTKSPEAFGKSTLEALALGKPVAGYAHGGVKEQLDAFLPEGNVAVGDTASMADLLARWHAQPPPPAPANSFPLQYAGYDSSPSGRLPGTDPLFMTPREAAIALNLIPGLGPVRIMRLLQVFASPELILESPSSLLMEIPGVGAQLACRISSWRSIVNPYRELELADNAGAAVTTVFDDSYPSSLRALPDPPIVLYSWGNWNGTDAERSIAVVGSRMATHYGRLCARNISHDLAEAGVTVISGLARGVDTEAHTGAMDAEGRTIAVIGAGLNKLYPRENRNLAQRIADGHGAVVSEFPMDLSPSRTTFPMRNRIVSGWSRATLVVEASGRSGALIAARTAAEQGREVFCIPGPVDRHSSDGCHALIRDGAILATGASDILQDMNWAVPEQGLPLFSPCPPAGASTPPLPTLEEKEILHSIRLGFNTIDTLCTSLGKAAHTITPLLAKMQIAGQITPDAGGYFSINGREL